MEEKVNVWKTNLTNGLILGLIGVVYSLLMYFLNLSLNRTQGYVFLIIQIFVLYFLLKSYRDNYMHGNITFGQSVGAAVVILLYYAGIMSVYTYILNAFIDTGLAAKQLAMTEDMMVKKGMAQSAIDTTMAMQAKFMKPGIMSVFVFFGSMFWGIIISLIISMFVKKEGNPLIDTPVN
jgi:glucan phosphoethanolaminetransferase (alkaline phosphatase superfamily)